MKRFLATVAATAFMGGAALAQTTSSTYYIVQDANSKKCTVMSTMPTAQQGMVVKGTDGKDMTFTTQADAEARIKTVATCVK